MRNCGYKMCPLPVFGTDKKTRIGYCKNHQFARTDRDTRTALQKHLAKQKKEPTISPFKQSIIDRRDKEELEKYFEFHMEHSDMVCENCGADLSGLNEREWKGCQHHILEKNLFHSVQAELINHAVLGYYCCHGQFHSSYKNAMQMPIWNKLVERVQPILHLVTEKHKILELFNTVNTL